MHLYGYPFSQSAIPLSCLKMNNLLVAIQHRVILCKGSRHLDKGLEKIYNMILKRSYQERMVSD